MESREVSVESGSRPAIVDLTAVVRDFLADAAAGRDGILNLFVPHATAGLVVIELGSGSDADLLDALERVLPHDDRWRHRHGAPGHGADHVMPLLAGPSLSVPVIGGEAALGTWQSIALVDVNRDNTRRRIRLSFLPG